MKKVKLPIGATFPATMAVTLTLTSTSVLMGWCAFAEEKDQARFNERKQHIIKDTDEQIALLQAAKSCFSAATSPEAMKACHEELSKNRRRHQMQEIDERMQRLQEEKAKLNRK